MQGPLGFLLFWLVALAVGSGLALLLAGRSYGWLILFVPAVVALLLVAARRRWRRR